jgi:hypothetical protein
LVGKRAQQLAVQLGLQTIPNILFRSSTLGRGEEERIHTKSFKSKNILAQIRWKGKRRFVH